METILSNPSTIVSRALIFERQLLMFPTETRFYYSNVIVFSN